MLPLWGSVKLPLFWRPVALPFGGQTERGVSEYLEIASPHYELSWDGHGQASLERDE